MPLAARKILLLTLFLPAFAAAQYRFDQWTADDGLPQNSIYSIAQTPDGYLWLTTFDGLVRFDGVKFTVFNKGNSNNLPTNRFTYLFAEADGTLWLGTDENGLVRYHQGQFQTFTIADGLPSNQIQQIQRDLDGSLLVFTTYGLARLRDGRFSIARQGDARDYKIYVSPSSIRWEMDKDGLRRIEKDGRMTRYDLPFPADKISLDRTINYFFLVPMFEDRDGVLWFAASGSLFKFKDGAVTAFTAQDGMPNSLVRSLIQDGAGAIWLGTLQNGVCRFAGDRFACFGASEGLSSNNVLSLLVDREKTLWVGTNERGINRITPRVVASVSVAEGLVGKNVYPILESRADGVWIGSYSGLAYYKDGKVRNYTLREDGLLYEIVQSLFEDADGRLWIGSFGGIQYLENGKFYDFAEKLGVLFKDYNFWDIHRDRNGVLWFATSQGLLKYENGMTTRYAAADGLPNDNVRIVHEAHDGSLWFSCKDGLVVLSPHDPENNLSARFKILTAKDGLPGTHIRTIYEDEDGTFWFGTYDSGLSRFKDGKFTNYSSRNGLYSDGVFQIIEDGRGNFWMSSNQGIYRVSKQQLNDFADGKLSAITSVSYGKSDGMLNIEANGGKPSGIKRSDGKLWFPTQDGVAIINPEAVPFNPLPPPVVLESAFLEGTKFELADKLEIQPGQGNLEIHYTGLSFIKPEQVRFKYKLEGLDEDWTNAGTRREAYFPYLPPGKYTFRVIAANSDLVWNEEGAAIEIIVKPAFYQTWSFLTLAALAVAAIVFWLYRRRMMEIRREHAAQEEFSRGLINAHETERRRIAAELHDSLGQSLAMIKNSAVFGVQTVANLSEAKEHLAEISAQSANAISEVREITYSLRPYLLDRLGLTKAISSLLNKIADNSSIKIYSNIENIDGLFENEAEISIYRIIQESLNNILKHAEASEAEVSISKAGRDVKIKISDNGQGFDIKERNRAGFGLLGMTERVRMLGGTLLIDSAVNEGTTIEIELWTHQ